MPLSTIDYAAGQDSVEDVYNKTNAAITALNGQTGGTIGQVLIKDSSTDFDGSWQENISKGTTETGASATLKTKVVQIGDWNMPSVQSKHVAHGIADITKIRSIDVVIIDDTSVSVQKLQHMIFSQTTLYGGSVTGINSTNVVLSMVTSAEALAFSPGTGAANFDNTGYNATSFNRGWVTIIYED